MYPSDEVEEPTDWRCLSRRDALRIAEGIQMLVESDRESHLPAVGDPQLGARLFGERREGTIGAEYAREFEKTLSERMDRVENQMERHSELIQNLHAHSVSTETSVRNLLTTVESFCNQATRRIEMATPLPLPAAPLPPEAPKRSPRWWLIAGAGAGILLLAALVLIPGSRPPAAAKNEPPSKVDASVKPKPQPAQETAPDSVATSGAPVQSKLPLRIELAATEPTWVSIVDSEGTRLLSQVLNPENQPRALELSKDATLVTGNAGGLLVRVNGEQLSSLGGVGQVRQLHFKDGQVQRSEK